MSFRPTSWGTDRSQAPDRVAAQRARVAFKVAAAALREARVNIAAMRALLEYKVSPRLMLSLARARAACLESTK